MVKKVAIITNGGDCPGLNAVIRAIVKTAEHNGVECYGFANFVMHKVTDTNVNPNNGNKNGWKYIKASSVTELKVGDIVRIGKSNSNGHTGVVLTVDSNGKCTFAQCFGGVNNKISIGTSLASSSFGSHSSLKSM